MSGWPQCLWSKKSKPQVESSKTNEPSSISAASIKMYAEQIERHIQYEPKGSNQYDVAHRAFVKHGETTVVCVGKPIEWPCDVAYIVKHRLGDYLPIRAISVGMTNGKCFVRYNPNLLDNDC